MACRAVAMPQVESAHIALAAPEAFRPLVGRVDDKAADACLGRSRSGGVGQTYSSGGTSGSIAAIKPGRSP